MITITEVPNLNKRLEDKLWYNKPAANWNEALPIGNGKLGAMVYGGALKEQLQLNEDSVWAGGFVDRNNPDSLKNLDKIRGYLRKGEIEKAQQLTTYAMSGVPHSERCYQTLGEVLLVMKGITGEITDYRRELDLSSAICTVSFRCGGITYKREIFASQPGNVLALRITASEEKALNLHLKMGRGRFFNRVWTEEGKRVAFDGTNGGEDGIHFCCMLNGTQKGGSINTIGEYLIVENATEAVFYLTAATSFRVDKREDYCRSTLEKAVEKGFEATYREHAAEYGSYFNRSVLYLDTPDEILALPTNERLARYELNSEDLGLSALYYQFGRYLLISCSRPGTLPANLQGLWADQFHPPWDGKYTININTEMNYWPAECCNLAECHEPLFAHLAKMYPNGKRTAQVMYGANGWVAHHNTDIWGDTAPQDTYMPATYWVMGAAWLCTHIWEHYEYTLDQSFLKNNYYLMKEACQFFTDYLIEDEKGRYVVSPTLSPENNYYHPNGREANLSEGCAMDSQILTELFTACIEASRILKTEDDFALKLQACLKKIPEPMIDKNGRIMEWLDEFVECAPGHRHISHLYALYPGNTISPDKTPELAAAARKSLEHRLANGGGHTGWSRAWIANFWAQLFDSDKLRENIDLLFIKSTLPNLFDNHPPFQIDGNFGGTAAIARGLVQSTANTVRILPALPTGWQEGHITGVKAKGGLTIDLSWKAGKVEKLKIKGDKPYTGTLSYGPLSLAISLGEKESLSFNHLLERA